MIILIFFLGLIFGSFVNALVWRLHEQTKTTSKKQLSKLSVLKGRSMCPACSHSLSYKDLVPVYSWLSLRAKCRYCKHKISSQYPIVELVSGVLFAVSYIAFVQGYTETVGWLLLGVWLLTVVILVALAVYDLKWMILPNKLVLALSIVSLVYVVILSVARQSPAVLLQSILSGLMFAGLFYGIYILSKEQWIGGGDIKLAFPLGLLAGSFMNVILVLYIASTSGLLYSLSIFIAQRSYDRKLKIPFGPFLIAATYLTVILSPFFHTLLETFLYPAA